MKQSDLGSFAGLMHTIASIYNKKLAPSLTDCYWHTLKPFAWEDVKSAFYHYMRHPIHGKYMPKPADIVDYLMGNTEQRALAAWQSVRQQLRQVGRYEQPRFSDSITQHAIQELGGWTALCCCRQSDMPHRYKHFEKVFQQRLYEELLNSDLCQPRLTQCAKHVQSNRHDQDDHLT